MVPVDFSRDSTAALLWAARAAERLDQPLLILHVVHDPAEDPGYYQRALTGNGAGPDEARLQHIESAAREVMDRFLEDVVGRHPELGPAAGLDRQLVVGVPTNRILEVAESIGARLIVMGSQGRTGLAHLILGSKAEQVVRLSQVPVTIVKS